jgi:hypothetical protein
LIFERQKEGNSIMAYKRKTEDVYEVVYDYGYGDGLEVLTQCSTMREAKADRKAYIENEHICPMIRKRRYPIHNNTVC